MELQPIDPRDAYLRGAPIPAPVPVDPTSMTPLPVDGDLATPDANAANPDGAPLPENAQIDQALRPLG